MKSFSSFCIALSAAALLAGALPGQAQSQTGTRFFDVASGRTIERVETRPATPGLLGLPATLGFFAISTRLDLFRLLESRDIQRWLTVSVTEDNQRFALFTDLGVKGNGVYRGRRESGERVAGTVSGFGSAAFSDPDAELIVSGTVTVPNPDAAGNLDLAYQTIREAGGWREVLRQMLYMESVYESARYGGGTERLGGRNSIIDRNSVIEPNSAEIITSSSAEHIARGTDITGRAADLLSANMRVYINGEDITAGKGEGTSRLSCAGLECSVKSNVPSDPSEGNTQNLVRRSFPVLSASHFVPTDTGNAGEEGFVAAADKVDVVQSHQGIHLALDRSGSNVLESPLAFGAW
ncbi:MAG: hypothetical protein GDA41_10615, partial [Rhodospirillales bacterium]|nr:hypothetical protein [Rhodospirillales bacterium]